LHQIENAAPPKREATINHHSQDTLFSLILNSCITASPNHQHQHHSTMFFMDHFSGYGFGGDDGVNRRNWADKSQAAIRREYQAKQLVDTFITECNNTKQDVDFPLTQEAVVTADIHLTDACWKSFRKYVEAKGCQAKRREASYPERKGATRKGKMYVINIVVPAHPARAVEAAVLKKQQAEEAAEKRREQAAALQVKKEQKAKEVHANSKVAFDIIMKEMGNDKENAANKKSDEGAKVVIDTKGITNNDTYKFANEAQNKRLREIRSNISKEKKQLLEQLETKERDLENESSHTFKRIKLAIDGAFAK
jgi:hypothetical protein